MNEYLKILPEKPKLIPDNDGRYNYTQHIRMGEIYATDKCAETLKGREASKGEVASAIHQTREWQALHLELIAPILEDAKRGISTALSEQFFMIKRSEEREGEK